MIFALPSPFQVGMWGAALTFLGGLGVPIALEFYSVGLRQRSVRKHLASMYAELLDILAPLIEEGIRRGEIRPVNTREAATLLVSTYEGLGLVWSIAPKTV